MNDGIPPDVVRVCCLVAGRGWVAVSPGQRPERTLLEQPFFLKKMRAPDGTTFIEYWGYAVDERRSLGDPAQIADAQKSFGDDPRVALHEWEPLKKVAEIIKSM